MKKKTICFKCKRNLPNLELLTEKGCVWCDLEFNKKYKHKIKEYKK